ncbi:MAG: binding-protein-dependent transport system inner rane component [Desulfomicrobiaceae bacterium]|jgi:spermidine/putrescine transport system permease protein|nr:ABC transporter permease subunit [Desulfomicrobiaceae bacterium]MBZ4648066.1 binding-protein-dependent transport system inner rane component [Desulfomicrobiaceae bacterium]MBZ4685123.1 binding-protein-dependent transport system inner rane component [Desulfomicrobiaceae bacterium]MDI3492337.1 spermidine/putrescine transport system permease protein [Desulfomicrobiaceae bacterium]MDK2872336.1 spermidine/putrescine transport system permease protein [Desulfomicrobiaceae bacterium]
MRREGLFRRLVITGTVLWMAVFGFLPNMLVLGTSVCRSTPDAFVVLDWTFSNYGALLDGVHAQIFFSSLRLSAAVTVCCLLLAYPFASAMARATPPVRRIMLLLVVIPFWTNSLVRTYAMTVLLNANGLVNRVLLALGLVDAPLTLLYTSGAVVAGLVYTLLPFMILPLYAALDRLDPRFEEAARDLGAGRWRVLWHVKIPLVLPGIITGCMLVFLPGLGMFYVADVLGGAKAMLVGNFIRDQFLLTRQWPLGAAASTLLTGIMVVFLLVYWWSQHRIHEGEVSS